MEISREQKLAELKKFVKDNPDNLLGLSHYEDGEISAWSFKSDRMKIQTGDGGALEFLRVFEEELEKGAF